MLARDRLLTALQHREPDHVPFDLGSNQVTGISVVAYRNLRAHLGLRPVEPALCDAIQQLALPDEDVLTLLQADARGLFPLNSHNWNVRDEDAGEYWAYHDEWGITHHRPKQGGLYYSIVKVPLGDPESSAQDIVRHPWPDMADPQRIAGLRELAEQHRTAGYAVMLKDPFAGIFEMGQRIRGMENLLMDMASNRSLTEALFEKLLELKLDFWNMALPRLGDVVDVISIADDYGTQESLLISPAMFRRLIKPRLATLIRALETLAPQCCIFFHSCGGVRPIIPDFIELGVDILNPVHFRAAGMEPHALKRDFGKDLVFWGGGVDTQGVLPNGTPDQVRDDVRRNIEALAPGGGYVFNTVHNIQADVPPQNIMAMWEAWRDYGRY
ncbi:MAG: uroporphyrinogen decarboxylase family protein [Chloroflexota bacterium]